MKRIRVQLLILFIVCSYGFSYEKIEFVNTSTELKTLMWNSASGPFDPKGTYPINEYLYYWLFDNRGIATFDTRSNQIGKTWKINSSEQFVLTSEKPASFEQLKGAGSIDEKFEENFLKGSIGESFFSGKNAYWQNPYQRIDTANSLGCLESHPLKLATLQTGESDLLVTMNSTIRVFSIEFEKIVFTFPLANMDELSENRVQQIRAMDGVDRLSGKYNRLGLAAPQFVAASSADKYVDEIFPAWRSFAKVYTGDFNENGQSDILMWRKFYQSLNVGDKVIGYKLKQQGWIHFERDLTAQAESEAGVTGEYLPQNTSEEDIQNWLAENDLTWSKGYPSKSECAGEEGQLIPEMHGPLLNDPDVLK